MTAAYGYQINTKVTTAYQTASDAFPPFSFKVPASMQPYKAYLSQEPYEDYLMARTSALAGIPQHYPASFIIVRYGPQDPTRKQEFLCDIYDHVRKDIRGKGDRYLHDPEADMPSLYNFTEQKTVSRIAHFIDNKPVNNSHGYQGIRFDEQGNVKEFAYLDIKGVLRVSTLADDFQNRMKPTVAYLQDLKAPDYQETLKKICTLGSSFDQAVRPYLEKPISGIFLPT